MNKVFSRTKTTRYHEANSDFASSFRDPYKLWRTMNADHKDALVLLARTFARIESTEAMMTAVDRLGFHVRLKTP